MFSCTEYLIAVNANANAIMVMVMVRWFMHTVHSFESNLAAFDKAHYFFHLKIIYGKTKWQVYIHVEHDKSSQTDKTMDFCSWREKLWAAWDSSSTKFTSRLNLLSSQQMVNIYNISYPYMNFVLTVNEITKVTHSVLEGGLLKYVGGWVRG